MDSESQDNVRRVVEKKPFLRKGTGLRRFYRNMTELENSGYGSNTVNHSDDGPHKLVLDRSQKEFRGDINRNFYEPNVQNPSREKSVQEMKLPELNRNSVLTRKPKVSFSDHMNVGEQNVWDNPGGHELVDDDSSEWESIDSADESGSEDFEEVRSAASNGSVSSVIEYLAPDHTREFTESETDSELDIASIIQPNVPAIPPSKNEKAEVKGSFSTTPKSDHDTLHEREVDSYLTPGESVTNCRRKAKNESNFLLGTDGDKELELFEHMEMLTGEQSFCSTSSTVQRFISNQLNLNKAVLPKSHTTATAITPAKDHYMRPEVMQQVLDLVKQDNHCYNEQLSSNQDFQIALLTARTLELEAEVEKYKAANRRAEDMRRDADERLVKLNADKRKFEAERLKEINSLENERTRLKEKRDRLDIITEEVTKREKSQKKFASNEAEVGKLRAKVEELEKDIQVKTQRWACTGRNMRTTMEKLKAENQELSQKVEKLTKEKALRDVRDARDRVSKLGRVKSKEAVYPQKTLETRPPLTPPLTPRLERNKHMDCTLCEHLITYEPSKYWKRMGAVFKDMHTVRGSPITDIITFENGNSMLTYSNGTVRTVETENINSRQLEIIYPNGDIKDSRESALGIDRYYYSSSDTWHTTHVDGPQIFAYASGHVETVLPDGIIEMSYPTGELERKFPDGTVEVCYTDHTVEKTEPNGDRKLSLPNGQVEYQTKDYLKRVYPDGTEKIVHNNGAQETRYSNGRRRIKDPTGQLIYDSMMEDPV